MAMRLTNVTLLVRSQKRKRITICYQRIFELRRS